MTREEAIKFAEYAQIMADGKPDVQEFYRLAEIALRAQQEQERNDPLIVDKANSNGWISVKDGLPDEDGNYIVTACDEGCPAGEGIWYSTVVVVAEYYKGSWTWYEGSDEWSLEGIVTHWMPLPHPPEEDDYASL